MTHKSAAKRRRGCNGERAAGSPCQVVNVLHLHNLRSVKFKKLSMYYTERFALNYFSNAIGIYAQGARIA